MAPERTEYLERTDWPAWVRALFWGMIALVCLALVAGYDTDLPARLRLPLVGAVLAGAAAMHAVLGGLTVRLRRSGILVHLGRVPLIRRHVPYADIRTVTSVRYRPIAEFGGWGIRGTKRRRAWSARGDEAVALDLGEGRQLLIGSDEPRRLEDRIRSALTDRSKLEASRRDARGREG